VASVDKSSLHADLVDALTRARDALVSAHRSTQAGVTHEDARAEGDKDMRATEASYVARGQAMRVEALEAELARVVAMKLRGFAPGDPAALSALITLENDEGRRRVFLAPGGGGVLLGAGKAEVHVVTPASPLGRALVGARLGDSVTYQRGSGEDEVELVAID
jgi:transcription elongation GreA/GreB family factor